MECLGGTAVGAFFFVGLRWKAHSFFGGGGVEKTKKIFDCGLLTVLSRH